MGNHGFSHVGLATRDMDATKEFYERVLGFETVRYDRFGIAEGGHVRHLFMDTGNGELISFMEPTGVDGIPPGFDAGINGGLGLPNSFYHLAFEADSVENLERVREHLDASEVKVTPVIDHEWCRSIYFFDPVNNLSLEFCTITREFTDDDRTLQHRFTAPRGILDVSVEGLEAAEASLFAELDDIKAGTPAGS
jgi:catechol 2,3-dioxygenase-like lactoylglutathione lyase family enzyme